jgi:drug/metabolite transporter (DMT)-like permease
MVYVVIAAAVIAVLAWNSGIRMLGARDGTLFMNVVPITTFTIAIARGYRPDAAELIGAGITVGALVAANIHARRALAPVQATAIDAPTTTSPSAAARSVGA